ncbi:MAG: hypothetical protein EBW28_07470, partial [Actinobacteria bacterium]|nr:hypothetical protein [Actinomycetota bacterium]
DPIAKEPISVVCRPGHALAEFRNITMLQLMNEPWIIAPQGSAIRFKFDLMVQELNMPQPVYMIVNVYKRQVSITLSMLR